MKNGNRRRNLVLENIRVFFLPIPQIHCCAKIFQPVRSPIKIQGFISVERTIPAQLGLLMAISSLWSFVYVSIAVRPFSSEELAALLFKSRERNRRVGITGMLLYKDGCFMQAFEGEKAQVRMLHQRIVGDPRHRNMVVLSDGSVESRDFSDWTMGFKHLDDSDVQRQPGFSEMLKMLLRRGHCSMDISFAIKLLKSFTEQTNQPEPAEVAVVER